MAVTAAASLVLRARVPIIVSDARYDDTLFVRLARELGDGRWLGPFDNLTLVKGPAYPLFVAAADAAGIPLKIAEQLTLLLAAGCLAACVGITTRRPVLVAAVFTVLALDPHSFAAVNAQVRRDGWYASLALLLLSAAFLAGFLAVRASRRSNLGQAVLPAVGTGLVAATFWLCREEGIWILPALAVLGLALLLSAPRQGSTAASTSHERSRRAVGLRLALVVGIVAVSAVVPVRLVASQNEDRYGAALTNDASGGTFARAMADWAAVDVGERTPYVSISAAQRKAVYAVSPAAREMRPALEDPDSFWRERSRVSCAELNVCDDYVSWLSAFAVRDAAATAGHFGDAAAAQTFFGALSDDIRRACEQGRLTCRSGSDWLPAPLRGTVPGTVLGSAAEGLLYTATSRELTTHRIDPGRPSPRARQSIRNAFAASVPGVDRTSAEADRRRDAFEARTWPFGALSLTYAVLLPAIAVLGALALVAAGASSIRARGGVPRISRAGPLTILSTVLLVAAASRLAILAVVDTTVISGASTSPLYQQATRLLLLAFGVVTTAWLADTALTRRDHAAAERPAVLLSSRLEQPQG